MSELPTTKSSPIVRLAKAVRDDLLDYIFPRLCLCCKTEESITDHFMCLSCLVTMPLTKQHLSADNRFAEHFWGRVEIETGSAMFLLDSRDYIKNLIHRVKYENGHHVAYELGRWWGSKLKESALYQDVDVIIPVPLHWFKHMKRTYNQSERFAAGLSEILGAPVDEKILRRRRYTKTQTKMNRAQRIDNLTRAFKAQDVPAQYHHALLIDDVLTTGSTLEACALALQQKYDFRISMSCIAMGSD